MSSPPSHLLPLIQDDMHVLIAFASKLIGKKIATPHKVHRNESFVPRFGVPPADHHTTNKRTVPILDAIASLSVFQDYGQVVAVALQLDRDAKTICLTVAENRLAGVEPRVVAQIAGIWKILQSLFDENCGLRSRSKAMKDSEQLGDPESPLIPPIRTARLELVNLVYRFCWEKMNVRVTKWWPCLDSISMKMMSFLYIDGNADQSGLMVKFIGAVVMLRMALPMIQSRPDQTFSSDLWNDFADRMDTAVENAIEILSDDEQCEVWGKQFKDDKPQIPVRRALEKLTSLHRHINVLVHFANSPRLRPALSCSLTITTVNPPHPRRIPLPSSVDAWQTTVEYVCAGKEFTTADWSRTQAVELADHFDSSKLCPTHCECSLIAHLEATHDASKTPVFSYIGVSKLSCPACMLWIAAFNRRGGRQYFTRGTHGKWYWPWAAPVPDLLRNEAVVVAKAVRAECVRFIQANGHFRSGSDRSDASLDKISPRAPEAVKKMNIEMQGGFESMMRKLKSDQAK